MEVCRQIIRKIKAQEFAIKIPFWDRIAWGETSINGEGINRRNVQLFISYIMGFTALRYAQREIDVDGCLVATEDDFYAAKELYDANVWHQNTKLTKSETKLLKELEKRDDKQATREELQIAMAVSEARIRQIINGKEGQYGSRTNTPTSTKSS